MTEFTDDELRYIARRLLDQPYRALHEVFTRDHGFIEACPDCLREVWYGEEGEEMGHFGKCPRGTRYAIMDKLDGYYGEGR